MLPWWDKDPARFEYELAELRDAGIEIKKSEKDERTGTLELELDARIRSTQTRLVAKYPPFYPYTRFEVFAPDWDLPRHQNPYLKNLCLIGRASGNWEVTDTLAHFISEQVPKLLQTIDEEDREAVVGLEEQQGEPISAYQSSAPDSLVLIDSAWSIGPEIRSGDLVLGLENFVGNAIRAAVLEVHDRSGRTIAAANDEIRQRFANSTFRGRWFRIDREIRQQRPREFLSELANLVPASKEPRFSSVLDRRIDLIAALFPEELDWRTRGDGWIFAARFPKDRDGFRTGHYWEAYFARTGRAGREDLCFRAPELRFMVDRGIAVIGLGCIGAASALEFARCGAGDLRLMDPDDIEPATTMRWPFGLAAAGRNKATAIQEFLTRHYPYTRVTASQRRFGGITAMGGLSLAECDEFLDGVDLIFDATAESGIHYLLAQLARERGLPYVAISASPGGWGGCVMRLVANRTDACWSCYARALSDGSIPVPPQDPQGMRQPPGCAEPTFTGAGFDLLHVPLMGVRLAVSTLSVPTAYPELNFDAAVLRLREEKGIAILPHWEPFMIAKHPHCQNHVV